MRKQSKPFSFSYPLKHKVVRDLKIVTETVGELIVEGVGYFDPNCSRLDPFERFKVDIDFVKWNGGDCKPVLEVMGGMDDIREAAVMHVAGLFETTVDVPVVTSIGAITNETRRLVI
jgi:hypothetical protein